MFHSLDCVVVQIEVRDPDIVRVQTVGIDGKAVVLCRDLDLVAVDVQDGMIAAMMAEFQFVGPAAKRQPENLMSEANPENRFLASSAWTFRIA